MTETYQLLISFYDYDVSPYVDPCLNRITQGHSSKLNKLYSRTNARRDYFMLMHNRHMEFVTLHSFKNNLDKNWLNLAIKFDYTSHLTVGTGRN